MSQRTSTSASASSSSSSSHHHHTMAATSTTIPLKMPAPAAAASGSGSGSGTRRVGKENTRSSRRRLGSTGPPVILGGGVGAIGKATELGVQNLDPYTTLYNKPAIQQQQQQQQKQQIRSVSPAPHRPLYYPNSAAYPSPKSPLFSSPTSTLQSSSGGSTEKSVSGSGSGSSHSNRSRSPGPNSHSTVAPASASTNSLSTTASTSSRTLKTPHSNKTEHNPIIASSSSIMDSSSPSPSVPIAVQRAKSFQHQSPTPNRTQVPAMAQGPLPPTPLMTDINNLRGSTKPLNIPPNRGKTPPPLEVKENRLSQNWVHIDNTDTDMGLRGTSIDETPVVPARNKTRLPTAKMVPVKKMSSDIAPSEDRPPLERNQTAPPLSPTPLPQKGGRKSLDQLRSVSPSPASRQASLSTPPSSLLDNAPPSLSSSSWKKAEKPPMFSRRSEDLLRTSTETAPTKKEIRAMQQRTLGVASTATLSPPVDMDKKPSGISLKKSSGALKALFHRKDSGKGKEKERSETPPVRRRPSGDELRRPSTDELRRPSMGSRPTPSPVQHRDSPESQTRASFSADRTMYPAPPPMLRAASTGTSPLLNVAGPSKPRSLARDAPAPPQTVSPVSAPSEQSPETPSSEIIPSSSLPYLSAMANRVSLAPPADITPVAKIEDLTSKTRSPEFSDSTTRASSSTPIEISPIKHSKSLHLLSLPDLDLDFDFGFEKFAGHPNLAGSPTTPRRSPRNPRSPYRGSKAKASPKASPARSYSTRSPRATPLPPKLQRTASERRRSQSFDGPAGSIPVLEDFWKSSSDMGGSSQPSYITPSVAKFFASASSSSAPMLSQGSLSPDKPLPHAPANESEPELSHSRSRSRSNSSRISSSDHVRTPSNASSTNETPSPSPPHTPPERNLDGLGFGDISPEGTVIAETPAAPVSVEIKEEPVEEKKAAPPALSIAPDIPLPPAPQSALASPAMITSPSPQPEEKNELQKPRERSKSLMSRSQVINPDPQFTIRALAKEVERLLYSFRYPSTGVTSADRATMLRNDLLNLMLEIDKRAYDQSEEQAYTILRAACFDWADALLFELRVEQPANERGACLEGLAAVVESACLSEQALKNCPAHQTRFTQMMIKCMTFVMSKLGAKGVFHNTLLFSGRFLAFAFFRVPHVGEQLVTVLQPPKGALMRFTKNIMMGVPACPVKPEYPEHLLPLCFDNSRAYTARLAALAPEFPTEEERDAFLFQPGNWLRRWQSDDSELFPAFYRAYHRQLAIYLGPIVQYYEALNRPVPASELMRAPGYAHLATIFAKKCHSYILGSVNAVTTSSSSTNFEATETAGFRGSQKPPVLETANRRLVETISTFANLRVMIPDFQNGQSRMMECDGTQLWTDIIDVWTKNLISKTSLYAPKGVFSLFDLLDGIVDPPFETTTSGIGFGTNPGAAVDIQQQQPIYSLLDIPHLIYVVRLILTEGEHALTLVKAIAFVFTHWEVLTARPEDRKELCLGLLLQKELFERLLLFWSQSVRSYILRLVVFRLGHIHTKKEDGSGHLLEIESVKLLQTRLDLIKRRHDELEPKLYGLDEETKEEQVVPTTPVSEYGFNGIPRSKSTITMVAESPKYTAPVNKAEKLLGLGLGIDGQSESNARNQISQEGRIENDVPGGSGSSGKIGKATNWLKKSFGNKKKRKDSSSSSPSNSASPVMGDDSPSPSSSPNMGLTPSSKPSPRIPEIHTKPPSAPSSPELSPTVPTGRKAKPPTILTGSPALGGGNGPKSPNTFSFEFELPTTSPRSDTFDPTPQPQPPSPSRRTSQPPPPPPSSPGRQGPPASPHMSKSFSKRSSLLPPKTASALEGLIIEEDKEKLRSIDSHSSSKREKEDDKGYDKRLHAYAIRMLAELEDAQKEYDEWWSDGGVGKMDGAPPRLTVAWPFHDGED
ncbi:hypothetical protein I302_104105 [Kwoniella bestiolae CBS 10118]|uniref:Uncharacterized protein n=1 Tax=Kwoniella bestiolae CBS 10118 TaxID=1296100 RepID=A0A1B9GAC1_9TREE|nr:hypothetical protein I302_02813 [Kwoniella bestiolae CBS 10118]OCF27963.1 hypothetical protein I302_02813 [Kwoniella bestiolae CBS 10118]